MYKTQYTMFFFSFLTDTKSWSNSDSWHYRQSSQAYTKVIFIENKIIISKWCKKKKKKSEKVAYLYIYMIIYLNE